VAFKTSRREEGNLFLGGFKAVACDAMMRTCEVVKGISADCDSPGPDSKPKHGTASLEWRKSMPSLSATVFLEA